MSILSIMSPARAGNQSNKVLAAAQTKAYEQTFLMGTLIGLLGLVMLLIVWISAALALELRLPWFLIGTGVTYATLSLWVNARLSKTDRTSYPLILYLLIGTVYVMGGLLLTLSQQFSVPFVLSSLLGMVSLVQGIMAWRMRPEVGWIITAVTCGLSLLLALLILLPWMAIFPAIMWSLAGLHLTLTGVAISIIAAVQDLSRFNFAS